VIGDLVKQDLFQGPNKIKEWQKKKNNFSLQRKDNNQAQRKSVRIA
jgi:hypothetical protein